jgi:hypothetical protein
MMSSKIRVDLPGRDSVLGRPPIGQVTGPLGLAAEPLRAGGSGLAPEPTKRVPWHAHEHFELRTTGPGPSV